MPSSISSSERRRRWPAGLLLGLALFFASEHGLWSRGPLLELAARYTPPGPDGDPLRSEAQLRGLDAAGPVPVVLLGSSQVREGLDCAAFERALAGRPCHNLAISAGSPLDMLHVARRAARRLPRRVTVLAIFPKVLHMAPKDGFVDAATLACLAGSDSWRRIGARGWVDVAYGLLQGLSPTLRYKDGLWAARAQVAGRWRAAWRLELPPQPTRLMAGSPPRPPRYFATRLGRLDGDFPAVGPYTGAQEQALERLARAESAAGQLLLVVDFPTRPGYETTLPPAALDHYRALLARLGARGDLVLVPRDRLPQMAEEDFLDFTHLAESGRARVSAALAGLVAEAESARRAPPPAGGV